jgi:hypothetical protein
MRKVGRQLRITRIARIEADLQTSRMSLPKQRIEVSKNSVRKEYDGNDARSAVAAALLREIDIALQPLLAGLAN